MLRIGSETGRDQEKTVKEFINQFQQVLAEMNRSGGFERSVLATDEGLPIANAPQLPNGEVDTAMVALLGQVSTQIRGELDMAPVDEVTIRANDRVHWVCRTVELGRDYVILGVLVPPETPYRRETNRAINRIQDLVLS